MDLSKATNDQLWTILSDDRDVPNHLIEELVVEGLRRKLFDPLVKHLITKLFGRWSNQRQYHISDLYQIGYVGLVRAMKKYEPGKCAFKTFAYINIKTEFDHQIEKLNTEKRKLDRNMVSLDKESNEKGRTFLHSLTDPYANPENFVINKIFWEENFRLLTKREKSILVLFADGYSMNAIAKVQHVSAPFIHRCFHKAVKKINPNIGKVNLKSLGLMTQTIKAGVL